MSTSEVLRDNHRFTSSERLKAYSDALYAIVLTVLIIPVSNSVESFEADKPFFDSLKEVYVKILIYALAFFIVYEGWKEHLKIFEPIEAVGDSVTMINLVMMLPVTCYPFACALLGEFKSDSFAIALLAGLIVIVGVIKVIYVIFAYRNEKYFNEDILQEKNLYKVRRTSLIIDSLVFILFAVAAGGLGYVSIYAGYVFLIVGLFSSWIGAIITGCFVQLKGSYGIYTSFGKYFKKSFLNRRFEKSRFTVLADGVYSIVATLIILDISSQSIPVESDLGETEVIRDYLKDDQPLFLAYFAVFITVGFLWFNHHSIYHFVNKVNQGMDFFNMMSLLFIGLIPFTFKLIAQYNMDTINRNESLAVQANCIVLFFGSFFQLMMWLCAHYQRKKHLYSLKPYSTWNRAQVVSKLFVYPIFSLIVFGIGFKSEPMTSEIINLIGISMIGVFILIKILFELIYKCCMKDSRSIILDKIEHQNQNTDQEINMENKKSSLDVENQAPL